MARSTILAKRLPGRLGARPSDHGQVLTDEHGPPTLGVERRRDGSDDPSVQAEVARCNAVATWPCSREQPQRGWARHSVNAQSSECGGTHDDTEEADARAVGAISPKASRTEGRGRLLVPMVSTSGAPTIVRDSRSGGRPGGGRGRGRRAGLNPAAPARTVPTLPLKADFGALSGGDFLELTMTMLYYVDGLTKRSVTGLNGTMPKMPMGMTGWKHLNGPMKVLTTTPTILTGAKGPVRALMAPILRHIILVAMLAATSAAAETTKDELSGALRTWLRAPMMNVLTLGFARGAALPLEAT